MNPLEVSIIIPCFNEEEVIRETQERMKSVLDGTGGIRYEILYIDDGSSDNTLEILEEIAKNDSAVKVISFSRNFGHQAAVSAGINCCHGEIAIIIDADLQDPPELFPDMIRTYNEEKCNVVYAVRKERKGEGFFKKLSSKLYYRLINFMSDVPIPLDTGDFRLIDKKVIDEFNSLSEKNKYIRGLISWLGFKQVPIYYTRDPRLAGETKYPLMKMIKFATTGLLYFSKKPLKFAISLGFFNIFVGIGLAIYVLIVKFTALSTTVPGWASLLIAIIFFGGIQLLTVGVLGEYIGSIFDEVKKRPEYIIRKKVNF